MVDNIIPFPARPLFEGVTGNDDICVVVNWANEMLTQGLLPDNVREALERCLTAPRR
jgi:hypothetical protein